MNSHILNIYVYNLITYMAIFICNIESLLHNIYMPFILEEDS